MSNNVGILGLEVYFPSTYILQSDLEVSTKVSKGKYTIGLGQDAMAFTGDLEDINSISLTVVSSLLAKYDIKPEEVGRVEIGTETLIDKSKSTKTILMRLFGNNTDIEGATVTNACYGGTSALINALNWADSPAWDGRYAIVVAADIAVYSEGPARPTGGCGAVAMLIGRNAPLVFDLKTRVTSAVDVWDFFKPNMESEYPVVNGALSQTCYFKAIHDCYIGLKKKSKQFFKQNVTVTDTDYFIFHSPYNKLVQKSFGRLIYQDVLSGDREDPEIKAISNISLEESFENKDVENLLKNKLKKEYEEKVSEACRVNKLIGNTYTASVHIGLASLVSSQGASLLGKNLILFSYGSGALASMFRITPRIPDAGVLSGGAVYNDEGEIINKDRSERVFTLESMQKNLNLFERLEKRQLMTPDDLTLALNSREESHGVIPFYPTFNPQKLAPGTFYLSEINESSERYYVQKPLDEPHDFDAPLQLPPKQDNRAESESDDEVGFNLDEDNFDVHHKSTPNLGSLSPVQLTRNATYVWASGRPNVKVVVTGVAAALPGRDNEVFPQGINNVKRIIEGESFITLIPDDIKTTMLEKNIVETQRTSDGSLKKLPIKNFEDSINVSASLGKFSLTTYGVSQSIVNTMDTAVQVAVASGLEALKDAGLVKGDGNWELPPSMQNTTGVVYATSFPALDTAIEEITKYFKTKLIDSASVEEIISGLKKRLEIGSNNQSLSEDSLNSLEKLRELLTSTLQEDMVEKNKFEFDRKFLFRVLVLGNAQLAQIIKAKGPNMQTNAACAGATQAIALAYDMIQVGRAERVVVIAGDNAASDTLLPWIGNGFRALGAATTSSDLSLCARPFTAERSGMILGSGGIGLVLESEAGAIRRHKLALASNPLAPTRPPFKCRLLGTLVSNSAYHGASMDRKHIAEEMERFFSSVEKELNITRKELAANSVYFSHETSTNASPSSSCAANEIYALREVFKEDLKNLLILNTKGFTGHPMGVSFEDVVAAEVLTTGVVPPIANFTTPDPLLGDDLKFSTGGPYKCKYAIRFAAGFGSQIALALYGVPETA